MQAMITDLMQKVRRALGWRGRAGSCHGEAVNSKDSGGLKKILLVGSPNVGKSLIFNSLTGAHVVVSNYPGTTVSVSRGKASIAGGEYEVIDTPGMYSLTPVTEEERVARSMLLHETPQVVLQVVDGKDLERMLVMTLQLIEAELPLVLDINMMDEAVEAGVEINTSRLEEELGIPVVPTVATTGEGIKALRKRLEEYIGRQGQAACVR